jgi:hypothetical protein
MIMTNRVKDKVCLMNGSRAEHTRLLLNGTTLMDDTKTLSMLPLSYHHIMMVTYNIAYVLWYR